MPLRFGIAGGAPRPSIPLRVDALLPSQVTARTAELGGDAAVDIVSTFALTFSPTFVDAQLASDVTVQAGGFFLTGRFDSSVTARFSGGGGFANLYGYRRRIVNAAQTDLAAETLSSFVQRLSFVEPSLKSVANGGKVENASGNDIRFELENGTRLEHNIDVGGYDPATGKLIADVRLPDWPINGQLRYLMYYGKAGASAEENPASCYLSPMASWVWPSGVDEAKGRNLTPASISAGAALTGGHSGLFTAASQAVISSTAWLNNTAALSIEIVAKPTARGIVLRCGNPAVETPRLILRALDTQNSAANIWRVYVGTATGTGAAPFFKSTNSAANTAPLNEETHVIATWDGTVLKIYVNGVESTPSFQSGSGSGAVVTAGEQLSIGASTIAGADGMAGQIERIILWPRALSAAEAALRYRVTMDPASVAGLGGEDVPASPASPTAVPVRTAELTEQTDIAVLPTSYDPDTPSGSLTLQSVTAGIGATTTKVGNLIRVSPPTGSTGSYYGQFVVSDGARTSTGKILGTFATDDDGGGDPGVRENTGGTATGDADRFHVRIGLGQDSGSFTQYRTVVGQNMSAVACWGSGNQGAAWANYGSMWFGTASQSLTDYTPAGVLSEVANFRTALQNAPASCRIIFMQPLLPDAEENNSSKWSKQVGTGSNAGNWRQGWYAYGRRLVNHCNNHRSGFNFKKLCITLGWELSGKSYPWQVNFDRPNFKEAWKIAHDNIRRGANAEQSGAGDQLLIEMRYAGHLEHGTSIDNLYPGDDYVDILGCSFHLNSFTDASASDPRKSWVQDDTWNKEMLGDQISGGSGPGCENVRAYARSRGKFLGIDEWDTVMTTYTLNEGRNKRWADIDAGGSLRRFIGYIQLHGASIAHVCWLHSHNKWLAATNTNAVATRNRWVKFFDYDGDPEN